MTISTSVWSAQHPNAGRNIQQTDLIKIKIGEEEVTQEKSDQTLRNDL